MHPKLIQAFCKLKSIYCLAVKDLPHISLFQTALRIAQQLFVSTRLLAVTNFGHCGKETVEESKIQHSNVKERISYSLSDFRKIKLLSSSGEGEVYLARHKGNGKKVILKRIANEINSKGHRRPCAIAINEIRALKTLKRHSNIARLLFHFKDDTSMYLVIKYFKGLDLFHWFAKNHFQPMKESTAKKVLVQLIAALEYAHQHGIAHMDLKLENVVFNEKSHRIKLIDFGLAEPTSQQCTTWCGTKDYVCPSILRRVPYSNVLADVWSLGTLLFILLYGMVHWCVCLC